MITSRAVRHEAAIAAAGLALLLEALLVPWFGGPGPAAASGLFALLGWYFFLSLGEREHRFAGGDYERR